MSQTRGDITRLLSDLSAGNKAVVDQLIPVVYDELRRIAGNQMNRERGGHTLSPTSLVHEAYLKLVNQNQANWQNRAHFFALASMAMRRILINYANAKLAQKRGGDIPVVTFNEELVSRDGNAEQIVMMDEALDRLQKMNEIQSKIIEYKFFGGLEFGEIAEVMQLSVSKVRRDWRLARAWLIKELKD